jgi:signal transduction histidine kinase
MSRLLVFVLVAVMIAAIYALVVFGLGAVSGGEGQGTLLPMLATAIIALAFEPFRVRAQRWANRLVYGERSTPYEILSVLTERLAEAEPSDGMLLRIADLLREGTGAERTTVWLGDPGDMVVGASSPTAWAGDEPGSEDAAVFPVRLEGETVGALELVKPSGIPVSTTERNLVNDVAGSVGLVLGYQRLNDSLARRAEELEHSRHRLMEAQDLERRRLERELHDGAQQQLV